MDAVASDTDQERLEEALRRDDCKLAQEMAKLIRGSPAGSIPQL
jgi:hypothetical protein